ncbi:hypothetical protein [Prosthecobacter dejongeii]|uniref:Uncharacterized protein n=1 Tax=Prosthecobacter dejongeii TaxID=48465 RepID=A0A7W7YJ69_9BACT|nr:hypothetical protein [Prosthecobacter dejongeii]MBB5037225.1 hypothetical protein [Prosthecobacter dejongeii]
MSTRPHLVRAAFLLLVTMVLSCTAAQAQNEYIICSGGPALRKWEDLRQPAQQHDRWWGNFVRPARVRMQELQRTQPKGTIITWLVYRDAYLRRAGEDRDPLTSHVESVQSTYGINLVWFRTKEDVINYINRGGGSVSRARSKISGFEFFGHSNKYCFLFDYSSDVYAASTTWLHENDLPRLHRSAFARGAYCQSWGCHTGESMSRAWKRATGAPMIGAIGKTDYSFMHLRGWKVALGQGGRWTQ